MADRITALAEAHAEARAKVEKRALGVVARLVQFMFGNWYDDGKVAKFKEDAAAVVGEAEAAVAELTLHYLDQVLDEFGVIPPETPAPTVFRRVDPMTEWERPAETFRYLVANGTPRDEAQKQAATRAEVLTLDDVSMAQRVATVDKLSAVPEVLGYRRIIHPELSTGGTCGLCAVAADRRYHVADLMPVHARCHCGVLPFTAEHDPGLSLNAADLRHLYESAGGSTAGEPLKRVRVRVSEHSELGPQLVLATDTAAKPSGDEGPAATAPIPPRLEDLSDPELEDALAAAWEAGDQDEADRIMRAVDERESARTALPRSRAAQYTEAATAGWSDADFDDELVQLMQPDPTGWVDQEAVDQLAFLMDARESQRKADEEVLRQLRAEAAERDAARRELDKKARRRPSTVDEQLRSDYETYVEMEWLKAEDECAGVLLNKTGRAAGVDPRTLWQGTTARARKYASEELKTFWQRHGRINFATFRADALGRRSDRAAREATTKEGWYDSAA